MTKNEMLSKEQMGKTLQQVLTQYLQNFVNTNNQNRITEEIVVGMSIKLHEKLLVGLDPWVPKEENKTGE